MDVHHLFSLKYWAPPDCGLALLFSATPAALALNDAMQVLAGGTSMGANATLYNAPGLGNTYTIDFPGPGLGKEAAALRMPAGTLSNLRVKVTTQHPPASGKFTLTVLKNGIATALTCQVSGTGNCSVNVNVDYANNDKLAVEAKNNFEEPGSIAYTYTLLFD